MNNRLRAGYLTILAGSGLFVVGLFLPFFPAVYGGGRGSRSLFGTELPAGTPWWYHLGGFLDIFAAVGIVLVLSALALRRTELDLRLPVSVATSSWALTWFGALLISLLENHGALAGFWAILTGLALGVVGSTLLTRQFLRERNPSSDGLEPAPSSVDS